MPIIKKSCREETYNSSFTGPNCSVTHLEVIKSKLDILYPRKIGEKKGHVEMLKEKNKQIYIHDYIITESYYTSNQQKLMRHADLLPFFRFHPHWPIVYSHPRRTKNTTTSSIICNLVFSNPPAKLTPENERTNMEPQQNSPLKEEGEIPSQNTIFGGFKICLFFWGCNFCSSIFSNVKSPPCCSHL